MLLYIFYILFLNKKVGQNEASDYMFWINSITLKKLRIYSFYIYIKNFTSIFRFFNRTDWSD